MYHIARHTLLFAAVSFVLNGQQTHTAPADIKPGSITYEDIAYPYPVRFLPLTLYGQDVRMACCTA